MTIPSILLRPATANDVDALVAIGSAACLSSIDQLPEFRDRKQDMAAAFTVYVPRQINKTVVLEQGGTAEGFASFEVESGEITDVWITPAKQRQGFGAILLASAEAALKTAGHTCTWLTTHASNRRALSFYKTHGYALLSISQTTGQTLPDVTYERAFLSKQLSRPDAVIAKSMADVRTGIDKLDPMLVSLLAERFAFIDRAADLKPAVAMPARVTERVEKVVANAMTQADAMGFDVRLTETLWRTMIDLAIAHEERRMSASQTAKRAREDSA